MGGADRGFVWRRACGRRHMAPVARECVDESGNVLTSSSMKDQRPGQSRIHNAPRCARVVFQGVREREECGVNAREETRLPYTKSHTGSQLLLARLFE